MGSQWPKDGTAGKGGQISGEAKPEGENDV